jgi:hypothetical protein
MNEIILIIILFFAFNMPSCFKLLPSTKINCSVDIDGAPKSETYPECYCKEPWKSGQVPGRPECKEFE